jgi:hypothetical protein
MRRAFVAVLVVLAFASDAHAQNRRLNKKYTEVVALPVDPMDILIGRFPRHIAGYVPYSEPPVPAAGTYEALAWRVRFGGGALDPAAYAALAEWHAAHGEDDLAWWAGMRALELGSKDAAAIAERNAAIEAKWKAAGRKDPPTAEQYRFVRAGTERWVEAFQLAEQQSQRDGERVSDEAVQRRIGEKADMMVPPAVLGAESFMRRWGVGLLIAACAAGFWTLYLVAIFRKRRKLSSPR